MAERGRRSLALLVLLIDTNIVSFIFKQDSRFALYTPWLENQPLAISFVSAAELYKWPLERNWGAERREALERFIQEFTILPYDDAMARAWAQLMTEGKRKGRIPNHADAWIAATALRHNLILITHNPRDFTDVDGLTVWSMAAHE